jgi:F-type H+-transporting ATPase subunit gamma
MISAVKLRKAQEQILAARPYSFKLKETLRELAGRVELDTHPFFRQSEWRNVDVVVVTGEKGLCGGFNTNVIRSAAQFLEETEKGKSAKVFLHPIGKKAKEYFKKKKARVRQSYEIAAATARYPDAQKISDALSSLFVSGETDAVFFFFNEFKSPLIQKVNREQILPIEAIERPGPPGIRIDYRYEPSREEILERLLPRNLSFQVYRILLESSAGEHGARMTAMDAATKNAHEMIEHLTLHMNKVRQASITRELIEVISSAEAL